MWGICMYGSVKDNIMTMMSLAGSGGRTLERPIEQPRVSGRKPPWGRQIRAWLSDQIPSCRP